MWPWWLAAGQKAGGDGVRAGASSSPAFSITRHGQLISNLLGNSGKDSVQSQNPGLPISHTPALGISLKKKLHGKNHGSSKSSNIACQVPMSPSLLMLGWAPSSTAPQHPPLRGARVQEG